MTFDTNMSMPIGGISTPFVKKDGKIGVTTQGEANGDCWFLSAVNALNSSAAGKGVISDLLEYHNNGRSKDGYTVVHLAQGDFKVTDREVAQARSKTNKYSSGDDDMIILELAAEKAFESSGDSFAYDITTPSYIEDLDENSDKSSVRNGGSFGKAMYMLTGKSAAIYKNNSIIKDGKVTLNVNGIDKAIELYTRGTSDGKVMNASITGDKNISLSDLNSGKKISLQCNHQYSIKRITNNTVTLVNPWNSGKEIKVSLKDFKNTFNQVEYLDLNEKNNDRNYITKDYTTDGVNKHFTFHYPNGTSARKTYKNGKLDSVTRLNAQNEPSFKIAYQNGKIKNTVAFNEDNTKVIYTYDSTGQNKTEYIAVDGKNNVKSKLKFNRQTGKWEKTNIRLSDVLLARKLLKKDKDIFSVKNNGSLNHKLGKIDENGNIDEKSSVSLSNREYEKLNNSKLLQRENLTPIEIKSLINVTG